MKTQSDQLLSASQLLDREQYHNSPDSPPAHLPDYFKHLRRIVRRAARKGILYLTLVLYARLSDPKPGQRDTTGDQLDDAEKEIRLLEKEFGVELRIHPRKFSETVSGWKFSKDERSQLAQAAKLAVDINGVVVAPDVSRFVRNEDYRRRPTDDDLKQLVWLTGKSQLATVASPEIYEDRSRSVKRGKKNSDKTQGRPPKKSYRPSFDKVPNKFARVVRLRERGLSWSEIAKKVGRARSTVRGWLGE